MSNQQRDSKNWAWLLSLGWMIAGELAVFTFGGIWLDNKLQSSPLFLLLGMLFSMIAMGTTIWRFVRTLNQSDDENKQ
jgi:F0F1-type ATP synthase assembly protein I